MTEPTDPTDLRFTLGVITSAYIGSGLNEALDHIADLGFSYVEIAAIDGALEHLRQSDLNAARASEVSRELARRGLAPNAFAAHTDLTVPGAVDRMLPRLRFAADLGAPVCVTGCGPAGREDLLRANLDVLVAQAERLQVVLALETNADAIRTGADGQRLVESFGSPWLGLNYDTANVWRASGGAIDLAADLRGVRDEIVHLHLKDIGRERGRYRFCAPGTGQLDLPGLLAVVAERTTPLGINAELPYPYRFDTLTGPLHPVGALPTTAVIDAELSAYRARVHAALAAQPAMP